MFLMLILMVAIKLCGMKPLKNIGEKPKDFQEDIHYMGIYGNIYTDHIKQIKGTCKWEFQEAKQRCHLIFMKSILL